MSTTQKVWVINPPKPSKPRPSTTAGAASSSRQETPAEPSPPRAPVGPEVAPWSRAAKAYLLGPVLNVLTLSTRRNLVWAIAGAGALVMAMILFASRSSVLHALDKTPGGVVLWLVAAMLPALIAATAWSRSVVIAGRDNPFTRTPGRRWWRSPSAVAGLGALVPGLGLFIAGCRWRAAGALLTVGALVASLTVLTQWQWIWQRSLSAVSPGMSGTALEVALAVAGAVAFLSILAWTIQVLDGARRVASSRPTTTSSALSVLLLVTILFFAVTFQPVSFAGDLGDAAASLQRDGFRLIPVALCEVAARLDPASPVPVAQAAAIYDDLGMTSRADARRELIERRLQEYQAASKHVTQWAMATHREGAASRQLLLLPPHLPSDRATLLRLDPAGSDVWSP